MKDQTDLGRQGTSGVREEVIYRDASCENQAQKYIDHRVGTCDEP